MLGGGMISDQKRPPEDLILLALWSQAIGRDITAEDYLTRAYDHGKAHIAWLENQPRRLPGSQIDRDQELAVAHWHMQRIGQMRMNAAARLQEITDLRIRATQFNEAREIVDATKDDLSALCAHGAPAEIRELALLLAEAQESAPLAEKVNAMSDEELEDFSLYVRASIADPSISIISSGDVLTALREFTPSHLQVMRNFALSGEDRTVEMLRANNRKMSIALNSGYFRVVDAKAVVRGLNRDVSRCAAAGLSHFNANYRIGDDATFTELATLADQGEAAVAVRIERRVESWKSATAGLELVMRLRGRIEETEAEIVFRLPLGESRQRSLADQHERALTMVKERGLPMPAEGYWDQESGEELISGVTPARPPAPKLERSSQLIGSKAACPHREAKWESGGHGESVLRCSEEDCKVDLAHSPTHLLPKDELSGIRGTFVHRWQRQSKDNPRKKGLAADDPSRWDEQRLRREIAEGSIARQRALAIALGKPEPTIDDLMAMPLAPRDAREALAGVVGEALPSPNTPRNVRDLLSRSYR